MLHTFILQLYMFCELTLLELWNSSLEEHHPGCGYPCLIERHQLNQVIWDLNGSLSEPRACEKNTAMIRHLHWCWLSQGCEMSRIRNHKRKHKMWVNKASVWGGHFEHRWLQSLEQQLHYQFKLNNFARPLRTKHSSSQHHRYKLLYCYWKIL